MIEKFKMYLETIKRYSNHTLTAYVTDLDQLDLFLDLYDKSLSEPHSVVTRDLREWVMFLFDSGIMSSSINRKISSVKSFFSFLIKQQIIEIDPALKLIAPKKNKRLPVFLTKDQINVAIESMPVSVDFVQCRDRFIIVLFYLTGFRLSELINLKSSDIDFNRYNIKVLGKGNKERIIPISDSLVDEIKKYVKIRDEYLKNQSKITTFTINSEYLIITEKCEKAYGNLIYKIVKRHLQVAVSLKKASPHVIRHTFATVMLNEGADINAIKHLLGHSSLAATEVYTHNTFEKLKKVYKLAHPRA